MVSSPLTVGDIQAEGESMAAFAVTQADLFVPAADDQSTRTDAAVLANEHGELWLGETLSDDGNKHSEMQAGPQVVDQVMQNVAEELSIIKSAGDDLATRDPLSDSLHESSIDAALGSEI